MRRLGPRLPLPNTTINKLAAKTTDILNSADPAARAEVVWESSRPAVWFKQVTLALGQLTGWGERCMYCSGSESAQVEHYEPKSSVPGRTFDWSNHLWVCGVCNGIKGKRFAAPPPYAAGVLPIDPTVDNPWDYFYIDEFGNLSPVWDPVTQTQSARALWTVELLGLQREALQQCRYSRLNALRQSISDTLQLNLAGILNIDDVEIRLLQWLDEPFQPEIASYFFDGPGVNDPLEPFKDVIALLGI